MENQTDSANSRNASVFPICSRYSYLAIEPASGWKVATLFCNTDEEAGWSVSNEPSIVQWSLDYELSGGGISVFEQVYNVAFGTRRCTLSIEPKSQVEYLVSPVKTHAEVKHTKAKLRWLIESCEWLPKIRDYANYSSNPYYQQLLLLYSEDELRQRSSEVLIAARKLKPRKGSILGVLTHSNNLVCVIKFLAIDSNQDFDVEILYVDPNNQGIKTGETLLAFSGSNETFSSVAVAEIMSISSYHESFA